MNNSDNNKNQTETEEKRVKILNVPNVLTLSRIVMIPFFVLFFYLGFTGHYFVALAVFLIASFTDLLDGKIARKYNLVTNFGKFLDPIADKVLVFAAYIVFLTVPQIFTEGLGSWALVLAACCVTITLAREIILSGFRMVAASCGLVLAADIVGKAKTVTQDIAVVLLLVALGLSEFTVGAASVVNYIGLAFFALSTILAIISGVNYIAKNFEVLKK